MWWLACIQCQQKHCCEERFFKNPGRTSSIHPVGSLEKRASSCGAFDERPPSPPPFLRYFSRVFSFLSPPPPPQGGKSCYTFFTSGRRRTSRSVPGGRRHRLRGRGRCSGGGLLARRHRRAAGEKKLKTAPFDPRRTTSGDLLDLGRVLPE